MLGFVSGRSVSKEIRKIKSAHFHGLTLGELPIGGTIDSSSAGDVEPAISTDTSVRYCISELFPRDITLKGREVAWNLLIELVWLRCIAGLSVRTERSSIRRMDSTFISGRSLKRK